MPITSSQFTSPFSLSTLDGSIGVTFNGETNDLSGVSVDGVGDVNGDGIDDVLIGAPYTSVGNVTVAGSTYLIFGRSGTWGSPLVLSGFNGASGVVINGIAAGDASGASVAGVGDVNGDGIDDMLIGAPYSYNNTGSSYLIFGHRGNWSSPLLLSSLNGTNGIVINGGIAGGWSGIALAGAGDVNGDGIDDVLIGAPFAINNTGSSYLIFGRRGTWSSPLSLSNLSGTNGIIVNGITVGDLSGVSVDGVGDVNGDGIDDVLIGAFYTSPGNLTQAGSSYLIFGHRGTWSSPLPLSSLNGTNGIVINGGIAGGRSGIALAGAGDVNGDGIDDLLISALAGYTYLIFGHRGAWTTPLSLSTLNGTNGIVIPGSGAGVVAYSVAAAGDINNDAVGDILIGTVASATTPGGSPYVTSAYLVFGHTGAWSSSVALSSLNGTNGVVINVGSGSAQGISVASAGDVNGDGFNDFLIGTVGSMGSASLVFGDSLQLLTSSLKILQGQKVFLDNTMLAAVHPRNPAINASIPFSIKNVVHGTFSTLNFLQGELSQQLVSFTHDGSIYAPSFEVTIGNWVTIGPVAATIIFDVPPNLYVSPFSVGQGQTVVLNNQNIRATSIYYPADALMFSVSNVLHGNFTQTNTTIIKNQFNQSLLTQGQIAFMADGSAIAPSYDITVSDGSVTIPNVQGTVNFNAAPILLNNELTLTPRQQKVIFSRSSLSASDTVTPLSELIFTPSTMNCHFENVNLPGTALSQFVQGNVQGGQILFVWDGYNLPAYNMSVSDGLLQTAFQPAVISLNTPVDTLSTTLESPNTVRNAIIGGTVSGIIGLGFLVLKYYLSKRMNGALKNILVVENSTVEEEQEIWKRETLSPVVKEVFNRFKTTGFMGYRNEVNTKAYVQSVELILLDVQKQGVEVHFPKLSVHERIRLLTAIIDEIKIQLVRPSNFGDFTKPAFTPEELKAAAPAIAKVVAMTVKKEKVADRIRHTVVERPKTESGAYPVMIRDNQIELASVSEQKLAADAANQDLIEQPSLETRMAAIEGHFAKVSTKIEELAAGSETRFSKIEASLEELLGHQLDGNRFDKPKVHVVN